MRKVIHTDLQVLVVPYPESSLDYQKVSKRQSSAKGAQRFMKTCNFCELQFDLKITKMIESQSKGISICIHCLLVANYAIKNIENSSLPLPKNLNAVERLSAQCLRKESAIEHEKELIIQMKNSNE